MYICKGGKKRDSFTERPFMHSCIEQSPVLELANLTVYILDLPKLRLETIRILSDNIGNWSTNSI